MKSSDVFIEKELVLMGKVPTERLFSSALINSIPSIFSNSPSGYFENFFKASGLKDIVSK